MIEIKNIYIKIINKNLSKIIVIIKILGKSYDIFLKFDSKYIVNFEIEKVDFIMPVLFNIAYIKGFSINLGSYNISTGTLNNLKKINNLYNKWYSKNITIKIENYKISNNIKKGNKKGLFFSGGVDSLFTFYKNIGDISYLISIFGLDIHRKDSYLINFFKKKLLKFAKINKKKVILIYTNLREFTEIFCSWNDIFGASIISVGLLFDKILNEIYLSSGTSSEIYLWGSNPYLDPLWSNGNIKINHFGDSIDRIKKIIYISNFKDSYEILRVCWKNFGDKYNCGVCEKCIRTRLEYFLLGKVNKLITLPNTFENKLINDIELSYINKSYYYDIYNNFKHTLKYKNIMKSIKLKLIDLERNNNKTRNKNKNILFLDFNGVLSYSNFWYSLEKNDSENYEKINEFLFKNNIDIVKDRMKGIYSSEEICNLISKETKLDYNYIFNSFIEDCKNIDLSEKAYNFLKKLKKYYHIILLTDNMDCFSRWILLNNEYYFNIFDDIFDSSKAGYFKRDNNGKVFLDYAKKYNSILNNSIFIDDSKNNCAFFESIGGISYNIKGEEAVVDQLKKIYNRISKKWYRQI